MIILRILLVVSTIIIYAVTAAAIINQGWNWPAVAASDLLALGWRSQFDSDFLVHLIILASWITWREGADLKAYVFGFLSIVMGGMFSFPYLLLATYKARGNVKALLLGEGRSVVV